MKARPPLSLLGAAAAYLALAVAWSWPLPLHAASRFAHDPGDPLLNTFILWWDARVFPLSRAMWNAPFYWPMHDALALTEHGAGIGLLSSPVQWLGGSPLLAYNLVLIATTWFSGLAVHALVRRIVTARAEVGPFAVEAAAFCAGTIWAVAPYRASQFAHLQVLVAWWMPVALLALHAYADEGRRRWLLLFGAAWLLQALSNGYYLFFFPVLIAAWIAVFGASRAQRRRTAAAIATWMVASLPLILVLREYYTVQHGLGLARTRGEMQMFGARWSSFLNGSSLLRVWPYHAPRTQEDFLFPGIAACAIVLAAAILRRRRGALMRPFAFYGAAAVGCAWLAAGPSPRQWSIASLWHAYDWIAWLPGFDGLRVPERFFMLASLCLAVAAGIAVATFATSRRQTCILAAAVCLGALTDGWIVAMPLGVPPPPFGMQTVANARVLELPTDDEGGNVAAMYREISHGLPVVNGYAGYVPPTAAIVDLALQRHDPSVLTELRRGRPLYVLVAATSAGAPEWTAFMEAQNEARMLGVTGAGRLYFMPPAPYRPQVAIGPALDGVRGDVDGGWLRYDLGAARTARALVLRTRGHVVLLRGTIRVETSMDGASWTLAVEDAPGGLELEGAQKDPLGVPLRILLPDPTARYLRINAAVFGVASVTIYGP